MGNALLENKIVLSKLPSNCIRSITERHIPTPVSGNYT